MKILWFINTSGGYDKKSGDYNGGAWITSLKDELVKLPKIDLAIAFYGESDSAQVRKNGVSYFPIVLDNTIDAKIRRLGSKKRQEEAHVSEYISVINEFKPDIIHVFGSEKPFGLIAPRTNIPVVVHLQGLINPYLNALLPPGYSKADFVLSGGFDPFKIVKNYRDYLGWHDTADRERRIFSGCKYFMGRTDWDRRISKIYAPKSKYFYCSEMIRSNFYFGSRTVSNETNRKIQIVSTISSPFYKGADLLLKTADILKRELMLDFEWLVFGVDNLNQASSKVGIDPSSVSVTAMGVASSSTLKTALLKSDVYFHPSYIDNSPNSICEAQLLGTPVVACNVGGISSLIEHYETGALVPANDPHMAASFINQIAIEPTLSLTLSEKSRQLASVRHAPREILNALIGAYESIARP